MEFAEEFKRMLLLTGKRANLLYLGDDAAVALGIKPEDLDSFRDETGIVRINTKGRSKNLPWKLRDIS